jgi:hypothetical protein
VDITSSSTDLERASSRIDSPTVTDLQRHLVTRHVMSPSMPGTPNHEIHISRPHSCGSLTDVPPVGRLLERSSEITAKLILDSRTPVSNSKGFDVSKINPAIARDRTSVFGVLDTEGQARQAHVDSSGFGSQVTEQMSSNTPHPHTVRNPVFHTVMRHPVARMTCLPASNPSCGDSDSPHGSVAASQPLSQHLGRCRSISGAVAASMACCRSIWGTMTATIFFLTLHTQIYT